MVHLIVALQIVRISCEQFFCHQFANGFCFSCGQMSFWKNFLLSVILIDMAAGAMPSENIHVSNQRHRQSDRSDWRDLSVAETVIDFFKLSLRS
jgi:hypothetical protein